jgi:hypothetical protein
MTKNNILSIQVIHEPDPAPLSQARYLVENQYYVSGIELEFRNPITLGWVSKKLKFCPTPSRAHLGLAIFDTIKK